VQLFTENTMWRRYPLKDRYDVVIIGAGVHGLSTAYYLAKQGVNNVAVIDKGYVGGGASGRNTAIIRANYLTKQGIPFFRESLSLYQDLAGELNFNLLFDQSGRLDLGHTESALYGLRSRTGMNRLLGVDSEMIGPSEVKRLVPAIDLREGKPLPILGALHQSTAGVLRHDAVVWGYGRGADRLGVEIHPFTEVTGIVREGGRVTGVDIGGQVVRSDIVMSATAGWSSNIARMVNMTLPLVTHPLQAFVTEPLKPFISRSVSSANLHVYVYQTDRGEVVVGGGVDPYSSYSQRSTLQTLEHLAANTLEMFPFLRGVNVLRQWAGLCDMSPDYAPIMGAVDGLPGFMLSCGWGTWGFKAGPIGGYTMAELIATGKTPDLIEPFNLRRFASGKLVNERAAAPAAAVH
jgi:sarcosine oxidase subunit beta